jgi:acyl carrier protein
LTGSEKLSTLGSWDSMAVISFMAMADDRFGLSLAPTGINSCKTVDDLIALMRAQVGI